MSTTKSPLQIKLLPVDAANNIPFVNWPTNTYTDILNKANLKGFKQYFFEIKKGEKSIGYAYIQTLKVSFGHFIQLENCCVWERIVKFLTQGISYQIAYCGSFFKDNIVGYYVNQGEQVEDVFLGIEQFLKVNLKNVNVGLLGIGNIEPEKINKDKIANYALNNSDYAMEINIAAQWQTFDDYLQAITKKYRARILKLYKENQFEPKSFSAEEIKFYQAQIQQLYYNILVNKTVHVGQINSTYIYNFKIADPNNFECIGYFKNNVLVGFATYIKNQTQLNIHYIGMDVKENNGTNLYHYIITDALKKAINEHYAVLQMGRTAFEAKAILGAKPYQINTLYKAKNKWLQRIATYILKKYSTENGMVLSKRNPFKQDNVETAAKVF